MHHSDIIIIGAGVAGLTAARHLKQAGYQVELIEKSRGLGGRLATRRLPQASAGSSHADHGVCYLKPKGLAASSQKGQGQGKGDRFRLELEHLLNPNTTQNTFRIWTNNIYELVDRQPQPSPKQAPCYVAPTGINALAKHLGQGLTVHRQRRAIALEMTHNSWMITTESTAPSIRSSGGEEEDDTAPLMFEAQQLIIAIPTPQAIALLETLPGFADFDSDCLAQLHRVQWSRCITAIATYPAQLQAQAEQLPWQGINCYGHSDLGWIGLDSSKQLNPQQPVLIVQSNDAFAQAQFENAAQPGEARQRVGQQLLEQAAAFTESWMTEPELLQVHRWGYAFALTPLEAQYLQAKTPIPLWFAGDWCGGNRVENAYLSGLTLAETIARSA